MTSDFSSSPRPKVDLIINRERMSTDRLEGLGLASLNAVISEVDDHLSKDQSRRMAFTAAIREMIRARSKGNSGGVALEVTSSLDPATKTIKHVIRVR